MKSKLLAILGLLSLLFSTDIAANEKDIYGFSWLDPDKEVYVLQNRTYRKISHFYTNVGGGITLSGPFVSSTTIQGRLGYFFTEEFGIEGLYAKNTGKENSTALAVRTSNGGGTGTTPFRRIVESYAGAMLMWSPFYSKMNTFNKIVYMDWMLGIGFAQLKEHNNKLRFTVGQSAEGKETTETHSGPMWDLALKFYASEALSLRVDLIGVHYSASQVSLTGNTYYSNFDTALSLGYSF